MESRAPGPGSIEGVKGLLGRLPLFAGLPANALDETVHHIRTRTYSRGTVIFHKDDPGSLLYVILKGAVSIDLPASDGKELALSILRAGDFFGELSLLDGEPRNATASALEDDTQTLILPREDFLELVRRQPQVGIHVMELLCRRLREADSLAQDSALLDLPGRLSRRILELMDRHGQRDGAGVRIELRLTQDYLARLIGATRVATNRQLQRLQQQGVLQWQSQHITVLKPAVLQKLALL
jgi:CRP/FNR family transcriptional regulator, cyclic AMP receptor protein